MPFFFCLSFVSVFGSCVCILISQEWKMEGIVEVVVSSLLHSVSQILVRETNLILNGRDQLESLLGELQFIHEFLRNSAGKRDKVKEVVKQIHDVALEAEDVIDDFVVNMARHRRRNALHKFLRYGEQVKLLRNVSVELERISNKIKLIFGNRDKYNITNNDSVVSRTEELEKSLIQRRRRNVEEDGVVGFNNDAELVLKKLDTGDSRRDVVSIIGMGGLGKTTLAKKIYNSSFVRQSFDCRSWVDVSQDYNLRHLMLKIADSVFSTEEMKEIDGLTEERLVHKMADVLSEKRYLIVLDDVWDKQLWDGIKAAFSDNGKKSRVLITSRVKEVALHASVRTPPYFLPFLNKDESWNLFSTRVFHGEVFPPHLEKLAREQILTKCKGLPLSILVVAGILRNREESMWLKVASGLNWYLENDQTDCLSILALSYDDLPPHLKPCFLYFGVFPEDFEIPMRQLMRLWVAEGFIDQEDNDKFDKEDMAEEYLLQLIDRSLILVARRRTDGGVKSCRIHDLLRDLSISKGKEEKFMEIQSTADTSIATTKPRRLSFHHGSRDIRYDYLSVSMFSRLHSLLCFGDKDNYPTDKLALENDPFSHLYKFCKSLRVLDLGSARCYNFPPKVEKLEQLRYLRLNPLMCREVRPPISKLVNLQTLDMQSSFGPILRTNLWEMQQLRHLFLSDLEPARFYIREGNGKNSALPSLRTLSTIILRTEDEADSLKIFPNLKKLYATCRTQELGLFEYLSKLQRLQSLKIFGYFRLTDPLALPLSLTKITLILTQLDTSAFTKLGGLPNLQILKLRSQSLEGSKIEYCSDQGQFSRLQVLHIKGLRIKLWSMEGQGLQSLVYLYIEGCDRLKSIPHQLKQLTTLRQLKVSNCDALKESLQQIWANDSRYIFVPYVN